MPNVPVPVLREIGVLGGDYVPTMGHCISPTPHLCRTRGQPPRYHCSLSGHPPRPPIALASWHMGILSSVHPGLPTPRDDPGLGLDQGARRIRGEQNLRCLLKVGRPRDGLGPLPPSLPPDRVHIQRPPPRHTQTDNHLSQAPHPSPQTRNHPRTVQLPFLQPHSMVQRPPFQVVLRKLQHGAVCFPRRLAPSPLPGLPRPRPNGCYLFRLTLPDMRTPGADLHSMLAPPLHHGGVPMVVCNHTRRGEAQFGPGLVRMSLYTKLTTPPLRPNKISTLS